MRSLVCLTNKLKTVRFIWKLFYGFTITYILIFKSLSFIKKCMINKTYLEGTFLLFKPRFLQTETFLCYSEDTTRKITSSRTIFIFDCIYQKIEASLRIFECSTRKSSSSRTFFIFAAVFHEIGASLRIFECSIWKTTSIRQHTFFCGIQKWKLLATQVEKTLHPGLGIEGGR